MIIDEINTQDFLLGLKKTRTVLVPIGATEEHGSHLPIGTDTFLAVDVCRKLAERRSVFIAPAIPYGVCRSTGEHPGTLGVTTETLKSIVMDLVRALCRQGLVNVVLLSGHAGGTHNATLLDAGECLLQEIPELRIAVVTEYDLAYKEGRHFVETADDSHAGEIETSRMLASRPQLVKGEGLEEYPQFPQHILVRDKQRYWPGGVWGNPQKASAEKGRQIEAVVVDALERLVVALENFSEG